MNNHCLITHPVNKAQVNRMSNQTMTLDECFYVSSSYLYAQLCKAGWFPWWTGPLSLHWYHVKEKDREKDSHIPSHIAHYKPCSPLSPSCSFFSHTQKFFPCFSASGPALHSISSHTAEQKSWDDLVRSKNFHLVSVGLFCIPDSQHDWIFHLHTRLLSNFTRTTLKRHCHSLLASSIFHYWHLLFCLEQEKSTSKGIFPLLLSASR